MHKVHLRNYLILGVAATVFAAAAPLTIKVQLAGATEAQSKLQEQQETAAAKREAAKLKLSEAKLKLCQRRETVIGNIMSRTNSRGTNQLDVLTKVADRTKEFYVKSGKLLDTYDALVTDLALKRAAAESAVVSTNVSFTCDGTDPKGAAENFKAARTAQRDAMKAYRASVKNLITGVKSVQTSAATREGEKQ